MTDFPTLCWLAVQDRTFWALVLASASQYLVPFAAQRVLLDRLPEERRERAWNALTWACALLWTGPLSILVIAPFALVDPVAHDLLRKVARSGSACSGPSR